MASNPATSPPLDEIQWRGDPNAFQGIHSNTILYYFRDSPFYDMTSNNEVIYQQAFQNSSMFQYITTRELYEGRLRSMSGLEFIVAQEPAESGPGVGTGVWVINKQTRRKRQGEEDEITIHATYFVVGDNIYMAPTLSDIISAKIASISSSAATFLPIADSIQSWSPARGRTYPTPSSTQSGGPSSKLAGDKSTTTTKPTTASLSASGTTTIPESMVLESLYIHEQFGGEFMDENPITGKPGEFYLSSTGRKEKTLPAQPAKTGLPIINTKAPPAGENPLAAGAGGGGKPTGKETKSPKTPGGGAPKPKRRKSKMAVTPS